jgi:hypothetical protein
MPTNGFILRLDDPTGKYYDILIYDRQLTQEELWAYELDYLPTVGDCVILDQQGLKINETKIN